MNITLKLTNLTCADCAAKIERRVAKLPGVTSAIMDFPRQQLAITAESGDNGLEQRITKIITDLEPEVGVFRGDSPEETPETGESTASKLAFGLGAGLFIFGILMQEVINAPWPLRLSVCLISYLLIGGGVVWRAIRNLGRGQIFDENFLMSVATIGAFATGEYLEGVAVMLFYRIGEAFQDLAVRRSRRSISALMDIRPDYANLVIPGADTERVSPETVAIGSHIIVHAGERVPLDGIVIEGTASLDMKALNGESLPREVAVGSEVLSGAINRNGLLTVEVAKEFGESTVSKILKLTQAAAAEKAKTERFITRFARVYTPIVVISALIVAILPPLLIPSAEWSTWIHRALVFLVVSCPCALVVSVPLTFFAGIGSASANGILIKGSQYMEALAKTSAVVFDKTGTLTEGTFTVQEIAPANGISEQELLRIVAAAESNSTHPIAKSIVSAWKSRFSGDALPEITEFEEIAGNGLRVRIEDRQVCVGKRTFITQEVTNADSVKVGEGVGTVIYAAADGNYIGSLRIADTVRNDSANAVRELKKAGVTTTAMLTGDNEVTARVIAGELGIDEVYAELLPHQKVEKLEQLTEKNTSGTLIFVGDGINDAPVLARADVGVAMGGLGSDAAIEAADVVLMTDEPLRLVTAMKISRKTCRIVAQNIALALGIKAIILILGTFGIAGMWAAVFGDVGVTLIAVLNALRAARK